LAAQLTIGVKGDKTKQQQQWYLSTGNTLFNDILKRSSNAHESSGKRTTTKINYKKAQLMSN